MKNLKDISFRLKIAKKKINKELEKNNHPSALGAAFKISTELVVTVLVGTIIGFILDGWFDTKPWFIIIFFFIGIAAGMRNVIRSAKQMQKK